MEHGAQKTCFLVYPSTTTNQGQMKTASKKTTLQKDTKHNKIFTKLHLNIVLTTKRRLGSAPYKNQSFKKV